MKQIHDKHTGSMNPGNKKPGKLGYARPAKPTEDISSLSLEEQQERLIVYGLMQLKRDHPDLWRKIMSMG